MVVVVLLAFCGSPGCDICSGGDHDGFLEVNVVVVVMVAVVLFIVVILGDGGCLWRCCCLIFK